MTKQEYLDSSLFLLGTLGTILSASMAVTILGLYSS